jgi:hypothetical protein
MRGEERKEGSPNKETGDGVGDRSLQSHSGANLNPKTAKNRVDVPKGGKADGVALTIWPPTPELTTSKGKSSRTTQQT